MKGETSHIPTEDLSAYVDSDLLPRRAAEVESHLEQCAGCRAEVDALRAMKDDLVALAEAEPRRDLWPAILRATAGQPGGAFRSWWRRFWMVPAAAVAGAGAALLLVVFLAAPAGDAPDGKLGALAAVQKAEAEYRNAIAALDGALEESRSRWSPQVRRVIQDSLAEIDRSIERCRLALKNNPQDPGAQDAILTAYQHKVDLLTDLVAESL